VIPFLFRDSAAVFADALASIGMMPAAAEVQHRLILARLFAVWVFAHFHTLKNFMVASTAPVLSAE